VGLALAVAVIALIWLGILPHWSTRPESVAAHEFLSERGIDPGAMFYSDLEISYRINARLERRGEQAPPSSATSDDRTAPEDLLSE
jgi:hypothetical protein